MENIYPWFHLQSAQSLAPIAVLLLHQSSNYVGLNQPYNYFYVVQDDTAGNAFHEKVQSLDGESVTGSYQVRLPDGRLQKVTYTANPNQGYIAQNSNSILSSLLTILFPFRLMPKDISGGDIFDYKKKQCRFAKSPTQSQQNLQLKCP